MSARPVVECDGPNCQSCQTGARGVVPPLVGWLQLVAREPDVRQVFDFCGWECVLRFAGQLPPDAVEHVDITSTS